MLRQFAIGIETNTIAATQANVTHREVVRKLAGFQFAVLVELGFRTPFKYRGKKRCLRAGDAVHDCVVG